MATTKVKFQKSKKALKKRFNELIRNKAMLNDIGSMAVKSIKGEVRLGKEPGTGESIAKFSGKNKDQYIERRKQIAAKYGSGKNFNPKRSNFTLTGETLEAIKFKRVLSKVKISAPGDHSGYGSSNKPAYSDLLKWHAKGSGQYPKRKILGVNKTVKKSVKVIVRQFFRKLVSKR